ncbi:MAG TPA: heavy metal-associated domain-containing protein, partial [Methylophilaceae bacterium]|nr:heavy metal-associated domain-containing protein [Methylophilaceae bacterium]
MAHVSASDSGNAVDLAIDGMSCASCVGRVEKALLRQPGVVSAAVNLATERAHVVLAGATAEQARRAVQAAGYNAEIVFETGKAAAPQPLTREGMNVAIAAALSVPLVLPMLAMAAGRDWMLPGWLQ